MSKSESLRVKPVEVKYRDKTFTIAPFFTDGADKRGEYRTQINDNLVEFYLCQWLYNERFDDEKKAKCQVFNSFFFSSLRMRMIHHIKVAPRRSELAPLFRKIFRKMDTTILKKEVLVIPVHIEKPKHWLLAIIHNPSGAIRRPITPIEDEGVKTSVKDPNNNFRVVSSQLTKQVEFEKASECRIIIMDSLFKWKKYKDVMNVHHTRVLETLRLFLQMAVADTGEEFISTRIRSVICDSLPRQMNSVDCGIYMMAYAEYFTAYNTEWMNMPTENLVHLKMDPDVEKLLHSDEPRFRIDRLLEQFKNQ